MAAPTLERILAGQSPPPYTLTAFMGFLSQNHCLETLEFTLDASRYQQYYYSLQQVPPIPGSLEANRLCSSWERLIGAYVRPGAPREVNLTSHVRDTLMRIPNTYTPPAPESLDQAVFKIIELMRESVLTPFIQQCRMQYGYTPSPVSMTFDGSQHYTHQQQLQMQQQQQAIQQGGYGQQAAQAIRYDANNYAYPQQQPQAIPGRQQQSYSNNSFPQSVRPQHLQQQQAASYRQPTSQPGNHPEFNPDHNIYLMQQQQAQRQQQGQQMVGVQGQSNSDMETDSNPMTPPLTPPAGMMQLGANEGGNGSGSSLNQPSSPSGNSNWTAKIKSQFQFRPNRRSREPSAGLQSGQNG